MIKLKLIAESVIREANKAPGLSQTKVQSVEDFLSSQTGEQLGEGEKTYSWKNPNIGGQVRDIDVPGTVAKGNLPGKKTKKGSEADEDPYIHNVNVGMPAKGEGIKYVNQNDMPIDEEKLKRDIRTRPDQILAQNAKMSKSKINGMPGAFYDITLPAYKGLFVDEATNEFKVVTTCPSAGECKIFCYARKGGYVIFPDSSLYSAKVINFLMNDWAGFKAKVVAEIKQIQSRSRGKNVQPVIRWHDAGDFFSPEYLELAYSIARETPDITHYAYTKRVGMVKGSKIPENFVFNFSYGGTEDASIDPKVDKHSQVVPKTLFKGLLIKVSDEESQPKDAEALKQMKDNLSKQYNLDPKTVISYNELENMPYDKNGEKKWNVMVWKGHGDTAAMRKDVLGVYLFIH